MKQLLLLRHAKSDWSSHNSDLNRPLNQRGETNAKLFRRLLSGKVVEFNHLNEWLDFKINCLTDSESTQ